jgi:hypothetical protein
MGGLGSGPRGYHRKTSVEESLTLDSGQLQREQILAEGKRYTGERFWWSVSTGEKKASISLRVDTKDMADPWMELRYDVTSRETDEIETIATRVALTTTPLPWGVGRWWFLCPICGRRCGKLHLGSESVEFACRICGGLTYRSCQESSRLNDRIAEQVASCEGIDEKYIRKLLRMHPEQAKQKGHRWARDRDRVGWALGGGVLCGWLTAGLLEE